MSLKKREPLLLQTMAIKSANNYVLSVVRNIVSYSDPDHPPMYEVRKLIVAVRKYLVANLHPALIDLLLSNVVPLDRPECERQWLLDIFMHDNMRRFNPSFRAMSPSNHFYESRISKLSNIVELNLKMVATDAILAVVGRSCPNLEAIDIVSKIGTLQKNTMINALRLEFFVSDDGLRSLHSCQKLKKIIMRKIVGSNCGGKRVTYAGIKELLMALPSLQYIRYNNMGYVLSCVSPEDFPDASGRQHLNLRQLHDDHTCVEHLTKIDLLCPNLKTLCLNLPVDGIFHDSDASERTLEALSKTSLKLSTLSLRGFRDGKNLLEFCQYKGEFLRHLKFHTTDVLSTETLINIGRHCPNLVSLDYVSATSFIPIERNVYSSYQGKYFKNLEALTVSGPNLDLYAIFAVCVYGAEYLKYLQVINYGVARCTKGALARLMEANTLRYLKSFICWGFDFEEDQMIRFLMKSASLEQVAITDETFFFELLREAEVRLNLHYCPVVESTPSRTSCYCYDFVES